MKRISKKVRDEAALICSILASNDHIWSDDVAEHLGLSREAQDLCEAAFDYVIRAPVLPFGPSFHSDAEAESLLRTGWSPS